MERNTRLLQILCLTVCILQCADLHIYGSDEDLTHEQESEDDENVEDFSELPQDLEQNFPDHDWWKEGQAELKWAKSIKPNTNVAKNVIFFVGDGMGISTESAARTMLTQVRGTRKENTLLSWQKFPHVGMSRTYNLDRQVTDSAASASAMLTGIKARHRTLSVRPDVIYKNCTSAIGKEVTSILEYSEDEGKWTGVVTTTRVTHATPGASYAHVAYRSWESDRDVPPEDRHFCYDIAKQLIYNNTNIREWLAGKQGTSARYVWNEEEFNDVDPATTDYLLGLFEPSHMNYEYNRARTTGRPNEPSLAAMTEKAIKMLQHSPKGYFLLVEGGRIDHAHHGNKAAHALVDTIALSDAVDVADRLTDKSDTLIVVSADHSHVFTYAGYPSTHNPIQGVSDVNSGKDKKPYAVLGYYNGPGFFTNMVDDWKNIPANETSPRKRLNNDITMDMEYRNPAAVPLSSETHAGEDVAIYARGPMSHLFTSNHENIYLAHAMMYASCVGPNKEHCDPKWSFEID